MNCHKEWFPFGIPHSNKTAMLFCFHCAGGNALSYKTWMKNNLIDIIPVEIPGRGTWISGECITCFQDLSKTLAKEIMGVQMNKSFSFYGHSLGALLAFQVAVIIEEEYLTKPDCMIVAGRQPPHFSDKSNFKSYMGNQELKRELEILGGTPKEVLENEELFEFLAPMIRSDYALHENHTYRDEKISIPIIAHAGFHDQNAKMEIMKHWKEVTIANFSIEKFPGTHFFIHDLGSKYLDVVIRDVLKYSK